MDNSRNIIFISWQEIPCEAHGKMTHSNKEVNRAPRIRSPILSPRALLILGYLAENGPKNCLQISRSVSIGRSTNGRRDRKMDYHRAHDWLQKLEQAGFIQRAFEERSDKGRMRKPFFVTLQGLAIALEDEKLWALRDRIVEKHIDLAPCVFGKWEYFKKVGLGLEAEKRLRQMFRRGGTLMFETTATGAPDKLLVADDYPQQMYDPWFLMWLPSGLEGGSMPPDLFAWFFFMPMLDSSTEFSREKWLSALKDDQDLREWFVSMLRFRITQCQDEAKRYKEISQELEPSEGQ